MLIKNNELDRIVISANGATFGDTRVDVMAVQDGVNTIHIFKCEGFHGTSVSEVLSKAGKMDRIAKLNITKQDVVAKLDAFGDKGVELAGKGMKVFGKWLMSAAEKISK